MNATIHGTLAAALLCAAAFATPSFAQSDGSAFEPTNGGTVNAAPDTSTSTITSRTSGNPGDVVAGPKDQIDTLTDAQAANNPADTSDTAQSDTSSNSVVASASGETDIHLAQPSGHLSRQAERDITKQLNLASAGGRFTGTP